LEASDYDPIIQDYESNAGTDARGAGGAGSRGRAGNLAGHRPAIEALANRQDERLAAWTEKYAGKAGLSVAEPTRAYAQEGQQGLEFETRPGTTPETDWFGNTLI
jgi:hypothetical protein